MSENVQGRVVQVIGPVVDVEFPEDHLEILETGIKVVDLLCPVRRRAARSACSAAPASARRSSSRS
jgi:F0F1-type ATP synthase beta subunit